jgi:hypothetical protein
MQDLNYERIINYTIRFIRITGMPKAFINKVENLELHDYRVELPCDFYKMIQVKHCDRVFRYTTDSFHLERPLTGRKHVPRHMQSPDLTYKIQGTVLFASIKEGPITISYEALPMDEDGFPMLLDNDAFIEALEGWIKVKHFTNLFEEGKLDIKVLENAKQDYAWAVGRAQTSLIMPTIDEMESITNMFTTLIPRMTEHRNGYATLGSKEFLRRH